MKRSKADKQLEFVCELIAHLEWIGTECQIISATPNLPSMVQVRLLSRASLCQGYAAECKATMPFKPKFLGNSEVAAKGRSRSSRRTRPALEDSLGRVLGERGGDHPGPQGLPYSA